MNTDGSNTAASLPRVLPGASAAPPRNEKLWKAAEDFQTILLGQLLHQMRATVMRSGLFEESPGHDIYEAMFDEAVAQQMARRDSLGLTAVIYHQLGGPPRGASPR